MARIRTVKPDFFRHEELQDLEINNPGLCPMLVFAGLWGHCDKNGVFEWKPRQLQLDIVPFIWEATGKRLGDSLMLLREHRFIITMTDGDKVYGYIPTFKDHQRINGKESQEESKLPQPYDMTEYIPHEATGKQRGSNGEAIETTGREGKGREQEGKGRDILSGKPDCVPYQTILEDMNQTLDRNFRITSDFKKLVKARWSEGFREDDFHKVCETMFAKWNNDPKMKQYLRPATLFQAGKFDGYLNSEVSLSDRGIISEGMEKNLSVFEEFAAEIRAEREASNA